MCFQKPLCLKRKLFQLLIVPYRQTWVTQVQGLVCGREVHVLLGKSTEFECISF